METSMTTTYVNLYKSYRSTKREPSSFLTFTSIDQEIDAFINEMKALDDDEDQDGDRSEDSEEEINELDECGIEIFFLDIEDIQETEKVTTFKGVTSKISNDSYNLHL